MIGTLPARGNLTDVSVISTGALPPAEAVATVLGTVHDEIRPVTDGANSPVYPLLAAADPAQFGLSLVGVDGSVHERGDAGVGFALMSVAKPFTFALVCAALGPERARAELGVNATGDAFNAVEPVLDADGRTNPMVNAGAIATCSRLPGDSVEARWTQLLDGLSAFAGRELALDEELYANVMATNVRNRELTEALASRGLLAGTPEDALVLYSRQSCVDVTASDLAVMGATLANGGVNPVTGRRVVADELCHYVLAVMTTAGMYEHSGDWLYDVGLPGKSGIGGGIVVVCPGKCGLGTFSPPLDVAGNSVRGVRAAARISAELGLDLFASRARS
jgi:glutaminase